MFLTSRIVRAARPRERRYVLADEHGMSLHVMPRGSKWWRFRCRFQHTERMISLGVYPDVNLATARLFHADARGLLARDIDPSADRKEKRAASARTFEFVVRQWFKLLQPRVTKRSAGRRHGQRCDANPGARHLSGPGNSLNLRHQSARAPHGAQADRAQGSAAYRQTCQANAAAAYFDTPSAWATSSGTSRKICVVSLSLPRFATGPALPILRA